MKIFIVEIFSSHLYNTVSCSSTVNQVTSLYVFLHVGILFLYFLKDI